MIGNYRRCRQATNNSDQKIVRFAANRVHRRAGVRSFVRRSSADYSLLAVYQLHGLALSAVQPDVNVT